MVNVLIVSSEPRLVDALRSNLGEDAVIRTALDAEVAQRQLFQSSFDVVFIDFEALRNEPFETFITIDNVLTKERSSAALLLRKASESATRLAEQLESMQLIIDLSRGRPQFDEQVQGLYTQALDAHRSFADDASISTDRLARREIDLPAPNDGDLLDTSVARLLYTLHQRKESGVLSLRYSTHTLRFGVSQGDRLVDDGRDSRSDLLGAFAWSHGSYAFDTDSLTGVTESMLDLVAEGCRTHVRQSKITEVMTPIMRRYPVITNLWEERRAQFESYEILDSVIDACDGSTQWESVLSGFGNRVADAFRAAYFGLQLDLVQNIEQPGLVGLSVNYSRGVRQARQLVDQAAIEKTKAFQASGSGRSELERELGVLLKSMRESSPHEIFGVWQGCGRKVVKDRFYVLVKEHHPDVYGGNTSGNVKSLAQDIFILVKDSYQKLLSVEKQQIVPPPGSHAPAAQQPPEPIMRPMTPAFEEFLAMPPPRPRLDTPKFNPTPTPVATGFEKETPAHKTDVRSKLATLSGFKQKQKARKRLASYSGRVEAEASLEESSAYEQILANAAAERAAAAAAAAAAIPDDNEHQRQAKLDHLLRRAQSGANPDAPGPAKEYFSKGYHAFREKEFEDAHSAFTRAYELDPADPSHLTFYAYTLFKTDPSKRDDAERMLRTALQANHRQTAPDACLFLGYVLKARGEVDEAYRLFKRAHKLNPTSREAERELRLAEKRQQGKQKSDPGSFIKGLFKK